MADDASFRSNPMKRGVAGKTIRGEIGMGRDRPTGGHHELRVDKRNTQHHEQVDTDKQ
jgi:hypothetical protein